MNRCAAGIIIFYPDLERLKKNIDAIIDQVDVVYCYNNGVNDNNALLNLLSHYSKIRLIGTGDNDGIPIAINKMAYDAINNNMDWFLTLDQDSICPNEMIKNFLIYIDDKNIGAICPLIVDRRRPQEIKPENRIEEVDFCITSGCFMNLNVFEKIHGMDEYLFIGLVDNEYSYRMIVNGYKIIRINSVVLDHELGNITPSIFSGFFIKLGELFHCQKLKALSYKRSVSPFRVYYATRNIIYLSRKYPNSGVKEFSMSFAIRNGVSNIIRSGLKPKVIKSFYKGFKEDKSH